MMGHTRTLPRVGSLWLLTRLPPEAISANWGDLAACAAFGALLPDLDAVESIINHLKVGEVKPFLLSSQAPR